MYILDGYFALVKMTVAFNRVFLVDLLDFHPGYAKVPSQPSDFAL